MAVRREGVNGQRTPEGILTRLASTAVGRILAEIESQCDPELTDLGFLLLTMSEETVGSVNRGMALMAKASRRDGKAHDMTIPFDSGRTGLTVHCSDAPVSSIAPRLRGHSEIHRYAQRAHSWFGICIHPVDQSLRFGLKLEGEWQQDARMDALARRLSPPTDVAVAFESIGKRRKLGRNSRCFCNSGRKYKKCHGK